MSYFQSEKLFQKLKQIQFEGAAFTFMNFRVPDLKKRGYTSIIDTYTQSILFPPKGI